VSDGRRRRRNKEIMSTLNMHPLPLVCLVWILCLQNKCPKDVIKENFVCIRIQIVVFVHSCYFLYKLLGS